MRLQRVPEFGLSLAVIIGAISIAGLIMLPQDIQDSENDWMLKRRRVTLVSLWVIASDIMKKNLADHPQI